MTQALACQTCTYWKKQRPTDNWGDCTLLSINMVGELNHAVLISISDGSAVLRTRDVFYCEQFKRREVKQYTVVDAAQAAACSLQRKGE